MTKGDLDLIRGGEVGGQLIQLIYLFVVSVSSLAMMCRHTIIIFIFFVTVIAVNQPPPHSFVSRTHEGSKTFVKDGEISKVSISKVFWTLQEGGYTYGKKRVFGNRENGYYRYLHTYIAYVYCENIETFSL